MTPEAAKGGGMAYYNEIEPHAVAWLRKLIDAGMIPAGEVDSRPIQEVRPDDIREFTQHHFFAGVAGWALAVRFAGWPDSRPILTGSCPCQPFSVAGKGKGAGDARIAALAKGNRIGNLRGFGNAIVPWLAVEVIAAYMASVEVAA